MTCGRAQLMRLSVLALVWPMGALAAQRTATAVVSCSQLIAGDLTPDEGARRARRCAEEEAVRQIAGVTVRAEQVSSRAEGAGGVRDDFMSAVRQSTQGIVLRSERLQDTLEVARGAGGGLTTLYRATYRVTVAVPAGQPDQTFRLEADLRQRELVVRPDPSSSDELILKTRVSREAFLTVLQITDDSAWVLFPNDCARRTRIASEREVEVPSAGDRQAYGWLASLPPGRIESRELLAVVATRDSIPFVAGRRGAGPCAGRATTVEEFNGWLVQIPLDRRVMAELPYLVRRAR